MPQQASPSRYREEALYARYGAVQARLRADDLRRRAEQLLRQVCVNLAIARALVARRCLALSSFHPPTFLP